MNCLIVDDDQLICTLLSHFCSKVTEIESITTANSGFEAIHLINNNRFDVIFLDFNLPDLTGREMVKIIPKETPVIMITSNKEFAAESYAFENILDYLVKPINFDRFFQAVQKLTKVIPSKKTENETLFVRDGNKLVKVDLKEVQFFKSEANYLAIVQDGRKLLTLMALKDIEPKLPDYFQRVHRSFIVNINKIDVIETGFVKIMGHQIPVSNSYDKLLLTKINLLN
ncbi:MAG TPA: LytTR family DNA-binding domain-containing protein [Saprospiraceae bacterium]|nr:LytTR family DNA-binding domain-containing protein [Saprospiraceae bacterium]HPN68526.1 LytTR family DNA-binding domain-containing protein [Saprospiraceae bacterium]